MLLDILNVTQHPLKKGVAKAVGYGWKVPLSHFPISKHGVKTNKLIKHYNSRIH